MSLIWGFGLHNVIAQRGFYQTLLFFSQHLTWRLFKFIFAGDLGVHYDHPLGRSDAASINFVPFDHDASQLVRVRRESPVADADYDAPHGSPASGSAIPQPSGSGNVVDNTLSTTIATTTKAPQISKRFDLCRCHLKEN